MEAIKAWAKSVFILSVFASTVMLLVPKSMNKQAKFVSEMLLLLCVAAPLAGLLSGAGGIPASPELTFGESAPPFALNDYLVTETSRRVSEIASLAGISVDDVSVMPAQSGYGIEGITITLSSPVIDEDGEALRETLSAYLSVPVDRVRLVVKESEQDL